MNYFYNLIITGYREKILTPEMLQKKAIKSQKRKQQADEKRENDKKRTMERLLKKHESKSKSNAKGRMTKKAVNNIIYISRDDKVTLQFPEGISFPIKSSTIKYVFCTVDTCLFIKFDKIIIITHIKVMLILCFL